MGIRVMRFGKFLENMPELRLPPTIVGSSKSLHPEHCCRENVDHQYDLESGHTRMIS
jgi:hypothetical protein